MDTQKLPPELSGLSPEQLTAAADFIRKNVEKESLVPKESLESGPIAQNSPIKFDDRKNHKIESEPTQRPSAVSETENKGANLQQIGDFDIADFLANGKVNNPQELLANVLNLAQQNKGKEQQEDTAYKA